MSEYNKAYIDGLNSDMKRLINLVSEEDRLVMKLGNAEFVGDSYNGRCGLCYRFLNTDKLIMISEASSGSSVYKLLTCESCAKKLIKEFMTKYV